jgi:hypothetical protein
LGVDQASYDSAKIGEETFARGYQYLWEGRSDLPEEDPESLFRSWLAEHGAAVLS